MTSLIPSSDPWADWVLHGRDGGCRAQARRTRAAVAAHAQRLLTLAELRAGMVLADVGCGEGLLSWQAFAMTGGALHVELNDVSPRLLRRARAFARLQRRSAQCRFAQADATALTHLADASVDVVALRAVLAYVDDKAAALREAWRVLRPGGCLALAEPVFQDAALAVAEWRRAVQFGSSHDPLLPLLLRWRGAQYPSDTAAIARSAICSHNERDLLRLVRRAGFGRLHLELHIDQRPAGSDAWEAFIDRAPHPLAPTLRTILAERFDATERARLVQALRPQVEDGTLEADDRIVFLVARKPG